MAPQTKAPFDELHDELDAIRASIEVCTAAVHRLADNFDGPCPEPSNAQPQAPCSSNIRGKMTAIRAALNDHYSAIRRMSPSL